MLEAGLSEMGRKGEVPDMGGVAHHTRSELRWDGR